MWPISHPGGEYNPREVSALPGPFPEWPKLLPIRLIASTTPAGRPIATGSPIRQVAPADGPVAPTGRGATPDWGVSLNLQYLSGNPRCIAKGPRERVTGDPISCGRFYTTATQEAVTR
jgi:hypothetical protein